MWYARADAGYRAFGSCTAARIGFVAQVAHQHHPPSSGEYAKVLEDPWRDAWRHPYYDYTAFARVTEARFGTAGFNSLRGPGAFNSDLGLFRRFAMTEKMNLEFRAEAFNWTNTPKFNNPSGGINNLQLYSDGSFRTGVFEITGTNSYGRDVAERILRVGLRLSF